MSLRRYHHWFASAPLLAGSLVLIFVTWWSPLAGRVAAPDGRIYFSTSTPAVQSSCDGNRDGAVDSRDVSILKLYWKGFPQPEVDCNQDGFINSRDLAILMGEWSRDIPALDAHAIPAIAGPDEPGPVYRLALPAAQANGTGAVGDRFTALVLLSGGERRVGAGEVVLGYDANRLTVRSVHTSPSIWTFWAERPRAPYGTSLVFAGGRPGGFSGSLGLIAEVEFEIVAAGGMGLSIRQDSAVYGADRSGTPILKPVNAESDTTMVYDGNPPMPDVVSALSDFVRIDALLAPSPLGPIWMIDLSALAGNSEIPVYEIEDGMKRGVQRDEAYVLGPDALSSHGIRVAVHHPDGSVETVNVGIGSLPGPASLADLWGRYGFWLVIELALAAGLFLLVFRRRTI